MIDWIKDKLELIQFYKKPLKIRSYTDIVKERVFPDIARFRARISIINPEYAKEGIRLLNRMEIKIREHPEAWDDINTIKTCIYKMECGQHPNNTAHQFFRAFGSSFGSFSGGYYYGRGQQSYQNNPYWR